MNYKVAEKFVSINGEGQKAGQLAVFIRFYGCNLKCGYCDTMWANDGEKYDMMTEDEIMDYVISSGVKNVTLTGGEPLLQNNIDILLRKMADYTDIDVEIETNGSIDLKKFADMENRAAFTMDYKLASSGMEECMRCDNFELLEKRDTVKFVCGSREDLEKSREIIERYDLYGRCGLYLSPVFGMIKAAEMAEFMKENKMNGVNLQLQLHKYIWNPEERGV